MGSISTREVKSDGCIREGEISWLAPTECPIPMMRCRMLWQKVFIRRSRSRLESDIREPSGVRPGFMEEGER
jgi:hypothetical protein